MKKPFKSAAIVLVAGFVAMVIIGVMARLAQAQSGDYYINGCIDGKTCVSIVDDENPYMLSLAYIDTPVLAQNYYTYSLHHLKELVKGETVQYQEVGIDPATGRRYGRMWANGQDVAEQLLLQGAAYITDELPNNLFPQYNSAQLVAARSNLGVWGSGAPNLLPWMYREIIDPISDANGSRGSVPCPAGIQAETECEAFTSFEQAQFARICGNLAIDPDNDGVACE